MLIKFVLKQLSPDATELSGSIAEYVFDGGLFTIGSDADSTIVLRGAAPEQAVVVQEGEQLMLINSGEGTSVNNRRLRREAMEPLASGDEIRIGNYVISIIAGEGVNGNFSSRAAFENAANPVNVLPENSAPNIESKNENIGSEVKNQNGNSELPELPPKKPTRNFADVLNALRTEEDSFYFIVENGAAGEETRVPIEQAEMPVGLNQSGQITCAAEKIAALYAIVRKDWSGIVVESQRGGAVFVNDEAVKTTARLRNGDYLTFNNTRKNNRKSASLELHEPSSLVALESILETRSRSENPYRNPGGTGNFAAIHTAETSLNAEPIVPIFERDFFGYFSFFEDRDHGNRNFDRSGFDIFIVRVYGLNRVKKTKRKI